MKNTVFKRRSINSDENSYQRGKLLAQERGIVVIGTCCEFSSVKLLSITKQLYLSKMAVDLVYNNKLMGTDRRLPAPIPILNRTYLGERQK